MRNRNHTNLEAEGRLWGSEWSCKSCWPMQEVSKKLLWWKKPVKGFKLDEEDMGKQCACVLACVCADVLPMLITHSGLQISRQAGMASLLPWFLIWKFHIFTGQTPPLSLLPRQGLPFLLPYSYDPSFPVVWLPDPSASLIILEIFFT